VRKEAEYNWAQARADLATAVTLRDAGVYYASAFFAQQAAEKALRSASLDSLHRNPKGHNLVHIADSLNAPLEVMNASAELNPAFLNTRSPEAANAIPFQLYDHAAAARHLRAAQIIVDWVKETYVTML
jgi:HEPN domain-containing protein